MRRGCHVQEDYYAVDSRVTRYGGRGMKERRDRGFVKVIR